MALITQHSSPGPRIKPIQPDDFYNEASITPGEGLIFRVEDDFLELVDVVEHDDVKRFGTRPKR